MVLISMMEKFSVAAANQLMVQLTYVGHHQRTEHSKYERTLLFES